MSLKNSENSTSHTYTFFCPSLNLRLIRLIPQKKPTSSSHAPRRVPISTINLSVRSKRDAQGNLNSWLPPNSFKHLIGHMIPVSSACNVTAGKNPL